MPYDPLRKQNTLGIMSFLSDVKVAVIEGVGCDQAIVLGDCCYVCVVCGGSVYVLRKGCGVASVGEGGSLV